MVSSEYRSDYLFCSAPSRSHLWAVTLFCTLALGPTHHLWCDSAGKLLCAGITIFWVLASGVYLKQWDRNPNTSNANCATDIRVVLHSDISYAAGGWQADKFSVICAWFTCSSNLWLCVSHLVLHVPQHTHCLLVLQGLTALRCNTAIGRYTV